MIRLSWRFLRVWLRDFDSFRKYIVVNLLGNLGDPVLYLLAMGIGLGRFLGEMQGLSYIQFLAPGIIASAGMFAASYECTYMTFLKMFHLKTYDAIIVTPVNIEDVVAGDIAWGASKALFSGALMFAAVTAFGLVHSWWALLILPIVLLVGFHFASLGMLVTTMSRSFDYFSYYFELVITPIFFFSGIFFPLDDFPLWVRGIANCSPLTHAVTLCRALILGRKPPHTWLSVAIIALPSIVLFYTSIYRMKKRLIK
ncbi:MAG: ABC transporter permease [Candidatus Aureabacteria bacterium]|nr:ABC transporter permease [Candidatus Auribacterota bacterium]